MGIFWGGCGDSSEQPLGGRLSGYVRDDRGVALGQAIVTLTAGPAGVGTTTTTGADGSFVLENLRPGTYTAQASKSGYTSATQTPIEVWAGQETQVNFTLAKSGGGPPPTTLGRLVGTVKDEGGRSLSDVRLETLGGPSYAATWSGASGAFELEGLQPGHYSVSATKSGYRSATKSGLTVQAGQDTPVDFVLRRETAPTTGRIIGLVRNETGNPLGGVQVKITSGPAHIGQTATTDSTGVYELEDLTPGTYAVEASASGYGQVTEEKVVVQAGQATNVSFTLRGGSGGEGRLVGTVKNLDGAALNDAKVEILLGPSGRGRFVYTSVNGEYELAGLLPGLYTIRASRSGYAATTKSDVEVRSGSETTVHFTLSPSAGTGRIVGAVRNDAQQPIHDARVQIVQGPGQVGLFVFSAASGAYELEGLTPGKYLVQASRSGYEAQSREAQVDAGHDTRLDFELRRS